MSLLESILTAVQAVALAGLGVFGLHRGWLVLLARRHGRGTLDVRATPPPCRGGPLPRVTVQLPIYNERYVAARLIAAVAALDWPRDRLQIQVLDDSTDDTTAIVREALAKLPADVDAVHLRRDDRKGFKAGALAHALGVRGPEAAKGELLAVFDADFVPPPDWLRRAVPAFDEPGVGMVQSRWEHLDREHDLLTRMQALLLDGHFVVEHVARAGAGHFFNFNGTAGLFRRECIDDAGGWQSDTLTEDMDLSYRAQLRGWRFRYLPGLDCPAELPADAAAFLNQQHRWAKGSIQVARKHLGRIWRAPLRLGTRIEASFHLLGNVAFLFLVLLLAVGLPLQAVRTLAGVAPAPWVARLEGTPLMVSTGCVMVYFAYSQIRLRRFTPTTLLRLPLILSLAAALAVNNSVAVLTGAFGRTGEFRRTPKLDVVGRSRPRTGIYHTRRGALPVLEVALGLWSAATAALAATLGLTASTIVHTLFAAGLLWLGSSCLLPGGKMGYDPFFPPTARACRRVSPRSR